MHNLFVESAIPAMIPTGSIHHCGSNNPDWPTLERVNRALSIDAAPWSELSSDGFRSFMDFEIGSDVEVYQNDWMCLCVGGDINCTSPEIAAGSPTITLASRIHIIYHCECMLKFN